MISHYSIKLRQVSLISLLALLLISVIGAAMADTTPMKPSNAPYQLSDLDKASAAPLQIMTPAVSAVMTDTVLLSDPLAVASVPAISSEIGSTADEVSEPELLSKTTLSPGVSIDGLACNILHTPIGKHRWSILQYDLSLDTDNQTAVFVSDEDTTIQSVSCSADGSQVLMATQDGVGGDSEIYLIDQTNNEILRLTDNDTDDLDVSMSQDGRVITWQGRLADDRKAVFVRTIAEDGSYSDIALGSKYPMTQPSLSDNGEWLILVNERNRKHVLRYQLSTGEFTTLGIVYTRLFNIDVVDPSISNDGTKALWGEEHWYQWLILTDLTKNTSERLFKISHADQHVLEHPMLSGDGEAAIYSINAPNKRQTFMRVLRTGSTYRLGKVLRAENQYLGNQLSAVVDIETHNIKVLAANGVVNVFPESEEGYKEGDSITLTAVADSGYVFESWESVGGECSGEQTTCSFVMPQNNVEVTANFKVLVKVNAIGIAGDDLAVLEDGTLMYWGEGYGGYGSPLIPQPDSVSDIVAVSTSGDHFVALKSDGTIVGWGDNIAGQLNWSGDSPIEGVVAVATGGDTTVILFADGTVKGYGIGANKIPEGLSDVVAVAAGYWSGVALKSDGTVSHWGYDFIKVPEDWSDIAAISTNLDSSIMALKRDGTIVYSSPTYQDPGPVPAELNDAVAIAGAGNEAVVLRSNGTIVTWSEGIISVLWEGDEEIVAMTPSLALTSAGRVIGLRGNFVPPELALD